MLRPDQVECAVAEGKLERIGLLELDRDAALFRQRPGNGDVVAGEIDPTNPRAVFGGQQARRAADAATRIENLFAGLDRRQPGQLARRRQAPAMELVKRRQGIGDRSPDSASIFARIAPRLSPRR